MLMAMSLLKGTAGFKKKMLTFNYENHEKARPYETKPDEGSIDWIYLGLFDSWWDAFKRKAGTNEMKSDESCRPGLFH